MNPLKRLAAPAALFALAVLWSNAWGQLREILASSLFHDNSVRAYSLAWQIPFNTPQILTMALAAAIVPVVVQLRKVGRHDDAYRICQGILGLIATSMAVVSLLGIIFSRPILEHFFYWEPGSGVLDLAVRLSRLMFPYVLISAVSGVIGAGLQSFERFRPLALGQLVPNVVIVVCILGLHPMLGVTSQAIGLVLGALAYLLVVAASWLDLRRHVGGTRESSDRLNAVHPGAGTNARVAPPWWRLPEARLIGIAVLPLVLSNVADWGTSQLAFYRAVSWIGAGDQAAWKEFQNAYRILQIPQGIFVSALVMVLLPYLSRFANEGDARRLAQAVLDGIRLVLFAVAPAVTALGALTLPVLHVLYQHGQFTPAQTTAAAPLSAIMAPYVLLSSVAEVLVLALLALRKVWLLLWVQLLSLGAAALLSARLSHSAGLEGVAVSVSLVALVNLILLLLATRAYAPLPNERGNWLFLGKLTVACAGVWVWIRLVTHILQVAGGAGLWRSSAAILIGVPVAILIYGALAMALRMPEWDVAIGAVSRFAPWIRQSSVAPHAVDSGELTKE